MQFIVKQSGPNAVTIQEVTDKPVGYMQLGKGDAINLMMQLADVLGYGLSSRTAAESSDLVVMDAKDYEHELQRNFNLGISSGLEQASAVVMGEATESFKARQVRSAEQVRAVAIDLLERAARAGMASRAMPSQEVTK